MGGSKYSCNPKAVSDYLLLQKSDLKTQVFWAFRKNVSIEELNPEITPVIFGSFKYFLVFASSKVIVSNARLSNLMTAPKKKSQTYIQTWHGTPIKKIGKDVGTLYDEKSAKDVIDDSKRTDLMISGCRFLTENIKRNFWYEGNIIECGTPRNDLFFKDNPLIKEKVFSKFSLSEDTNIVLYAPTFRNNNDTSVYNINYNQILATLKKKYGGKWVFFVRFHPIMMKDIDDLPVEFNNSIINTTFYDDIQDLLYVSDILITDYSSCIFDYSFLNRPAFLYCLDYGKYDRGTYFDLQQMPFPFALNEKSLIDNINNFDIIKYKNELNNFNKEILGNVETGSASEKVVEYILMKCRN